MEPCGEGIIPLSKLETVDAFLIDVGCELFVWIGKKASAAEKQQGMALAQRYIAVSMTERACVCMFCLLLMAGDAQDNKRPSWLPITKLHEGAENEYFKTYLAGEKRKVC